MKENEVRNDLYLANKRFIESCRYIWWGLKIMKIRIKSNKDLKVVGKI